MYANPRRFIGGFRFPASCTSTNRVATSVASVALYYAALLLLLTPRVAVSGPEFQCPGTRYVYTSNVGVPDPANTATTCVTAYDGGTVASNGTFNTATPFSLGSSIWTAVTDAFGQLLQIINNVGTAWNLGPLPGRTESIGSTPALQTRYTYDALDRVTSTVAPVSPMSVTTTYTYDATYPNQVATTDRNGNATTYTYDSGRPDTVTQTSGSPVKYQYDSLGRPTRAEDQPPGGGRVLTYTYDDGNRTVTRTDNTGPTPTTYTYDAMNRVTRVVDAVGNTTSYGYDPVGNLTAVTETPPPPANPDPDRVFQYQYDVQGRVTEILDSMDQGNPADDRYTCYQYDSVGRLANYTEDTQSMCNSGLAMTTKFAYDARGQLSSIVDHEGAQAQLTYVPAPGSLLLLSLGLGALAMRRRA